MTVYRLFQRAYHLWERIVREAKVFPMRRRVFGFRVAYETFRDGLIPPGKSHRPQEFANSVSPENRIDPVS